MDIRITLLIRCKLCLMFKKKKSCFSAARHMKISEKLVTLKTKIGYQVIYKHRLYYTFISCRITDSC